MNEKELETRQAAVLGQKYAFATASLLLGIACFINLCGMERALLAVAFAWLALKPEPGPPLRERRLWAKFGLALGLTCLVLVPTMMVLYFDRLRALILALEKLP